ncbi:hypothetical protein K501DRAFT_179070 [Backusella circina FSU 941]|nr:hypothetical protein K501DRAFT_179070 [Backusella circina FSU 941]
MVNVIYLRYSLSVFLDNKGSTARDHLANERTFLAWIRTSLSLTTSGIATIQIFDILDDSHQKVGKILGLLFVITSLLFVLFANVRYFHIQTSLQSGSFPASRSIVTIASFIVLFISTSILFIVILEL